MREQDDGPFRAEVVAALESALERPEGGTTILVAIAQEPESREIAGVVAALEAWPPRRWLELDVGRLRDWTRDDGVSAPDRGWASALDQLHSSTLLLVLASTHPDGFQRERAARLLGRRTGLLAAAALAVRAVDHVPQIRRVAMSALMERPDATTAGIVVPILIAGRSRYAAVGVFEEYAGNLSTETLRALIHSNDDATRQFAIAGAPLTVRELVDLAAREPNTRARLIAARRAISLGGADELLSVRPAGVRALAVSVASEELVMARLDALLLDKSAQLRRAAQIRASKLQVDPATLYRAHLPTRIAANGLGETGSEADLELLVPLVDDGFSPSVRRAAIRAVAQLTPAGRLLAVLPQLPALLEGPEPSLARAAARQLRRLRYGVSAPEFERTLKSPHVWTRQSALGMARGGSRWRTAVAAVALYDDPDAALRDYARSVLNTWVRFNSATAGQPTVKEAGWLLASLADVELPRDLEREIRFHADLGGAARA